VRSLAKGYHSPVSGYSLSATNPNILFVSTFAGTIYKWDWVEGKKIARWDVSSQITRLATAAMPNADEDIVYTIDKSDKRGKWMITAHKLMAGNQAPGSELSTLCKSQEPITGLNVMDGGMILIATSGKRLMIGLRNELHQTSLATTTYTWRETMLPEYITCFDVRLPNSPISLRSEKLKDRNVASKSSVDIVVGNVKGEIYIFKDFLSILMQRERPDKAGNLASFAALLQHWHREAVRTVKWSRDGKIPWSHLRNHIGLSVSRQLYYLWWCRDRSGVVAARHWRKAVSSPSIVSYRDSCRLPYRLCVRTFALR